MRFYKYFLIILGLFVLFSAGVIAQTDDLPDIDTLEEGWNIIEPGGDTTCAFGTPYNYYVHPGAEAENLLIYFQGGGACWNGLTCREGGPFDSAAGGNELQDYAGIFDFENPANPVADYNIVFLPYCTADVHIGDTSVEYPTGVTIEHRGAVNSFAVLDWVYANFEAPEQVIVTGSSAGAVAATYYASHIMEHYQDSEVMHFSDGYIGVTPIGWEVFQTWNIFAHMPEFIPTLANVNPDEYYINVQYTETAEAFPDNTFSQFTNAEDEVQQTFFRFMGGDADRIAEFIQEHLAELEDTLNTFSYYVAPGLDHTTLAYDQFYDLEVDGVLFRDWLAALLEGEPVDDVNCCAIADS